MPTAISCPETLKMTHGLRACHDAILVGVGTVIADNPSLTVRHWEGGELLRIPEQSQKWARVLHNKQSYNVMCLT